MCSHVCIPVRKCSFLMLYNRKITDVSCSNRNGLTNNISGAAGQVRSVIATTKHLGVIFGPVLCGIAAQVHDQGDVQCSCAAGECKQAS